MLQMLSVMLLAALGADGASASLTGRLLQVAALDASSFSAKGLNNEALLNRFYRGDFVNIEFDRNDLMFEGLFNQYLSAYARHCSDALPQNRVEITSQYDTKRLYADPDMYAAKEELDRIIAADTVRNVGRMMTQLTQSPLATGSSIVVGGLAGASDMDALVQMNACAGPGLKRFQENLRLFALNKPPIRLGAEGRPTVAGAESAAYPDQNYAMLLDDLVSANAGTWVMNQYVRGSVVGAAVTSNDPSGRPARVEGRYTFIGFEGRSQPGAVTVSFSDGLPQCLYFSDRPTDCQPANRRFVALFADGAYRRTPEMVAAELEAARWKEAAAVAARERRQQWELQRARALDEQGKFTAFSNSNWAKPNASRPDVIRQLEIQSRVSHGTRGGIERSNLKTGVTVYRGGDDRVLVQYLDKDSGRVRFLDATEPIHWYLAFAGNPDKALLREQLGLKEMPSTRGPQYANYVTAIAKRDQIDLNAKLSGLAPVIGREVAQDGGGTRYVQNYSQFSRTNAVPLAVAIARDWATDQPLKDRTRKARPSATGPDIFVSRGGEVLLRDVVSGEERLVDVTVELARYQSLQGRQFVDEKGKARAVPSSMNLKDYESQVRRYVDNLGIDLRAMMPGLSLILGSHPELKQQDALALASYVETEHGKFDDDHSHRGGLFGVFTHLR